MISRQPPTVRLRRALGVALRRVRARVEPWRMRLTLPAGVRIEPPVVLTRARLSRTCSFGAFTYCNHSCEIAEAEVGRYCSIGQGVLINPGNHPTNWLSTHPFVSDASGEAAGMSEIAAYRAILGTRHPTPRRERGDRVIIGNDVWIGARAIILGGCTIGHGAIIAAGAIVTHDVQPYEVVGGVPARHLRSRFAPDLVDRLLKSEWWNWDLSTFPGERDYTDVAAFLDCLEAAVRSGVLRRLGADSAAPPR